MSDSVLDRVASRRLDERSALADELQQPEDLGCFGWLRGVRERAVMLELRKRDGNILAIGYNWLERVEFDPSIGITLHAAGQEIRIIGRNLNSEVRPHVRLLDGIVRHRVPWLSEESHIRAVPDDRALIAIERVTW